MVRLWDAASGQAVGHALEHPRGVRSVAFSPDGKTILTGCQDGVVRLWGAATGQPVGQPMKNPGLGGLWVKYRAAFSPDGKTILSVGEDYTARLWGAATGQAVGRPMVHSAQVRSVAFSPDGKLILTGSDDKTAQLWDAATGERIGRAFEHPAPVYSAAFSPDGKTILTGCRDQRARLWDRDTGQPIGPPLEHPYYVLGVAFSPDGRFLLTQGSDNAARLWDAPAPLPEDPPRLAAWVEAVTGLELDERGAVHPLDRDAWQERRRRLEQLGGPPPDPAPRLDPILFGDEPAARGDALAERGLWDRAEAAYLEAVRARPLDAGWRTNSAWTALTRFYIARGRPERAVAELGAAISRWPDALELRLWHCLALLAAGDRVGWERAIAGLLDRFPGPMNPWWRDADMVAVLCAQGPYRLPDPEVPVRLAEAAIRNATEVGFNFKPHGFRNTLGAALYRAGLYDEAIRRLEEGIQARGGMSLPQDWAFLAMAHHRLGHLDEARRWLEKFQDRPPVADSADFWNELEVRLLRSEAEAVILYDPVFPDDPFAR
jgi:tetratricopeptide (TPR) repeat protein